jgi:hypothetical protein
MHDHNNITLATGSGISEMGLMWTLMAIMFIWNLHMVYQHNKLKKTVAHHCGSQKCIKCENRKDL